MLDLILMFTVVISASLSVYYSFKTRSIRKEYLNVSMRGKTKKKPGKKEQQLYVSMRFYNAKTNTAMGIMLIAMAITQSLFPELTVWRLMVGAIFLALGIFNLVMGIRHYRTYAPQVSQDIL